MHLNENIVGPVDPPTHLAQRGSNLLLHCGAYAVDLNQIRSTVTPASTRTWHPIPHYELIELVKATLETSGLKIGAQAHSLTTDGLRYFGLMQVEGSYLASSADYGWVLGLRNSHDKKFPAGVVAGASVFVCDNLSFSGEVKFARRHTRFISRDLPQPASRAVGKLLEKWHDQDKRIAAYRETLISDRDAHDLIVRSTDIGVCSNRMIPSVLQEWRKPRYAEFQRRDLWSLFNSFTEALKVTSLPDLARRTEALHAIFDSHVGLGALQGDN